MVASLLPAYASEPCQEGRLVSLSQPCPGVTLTQFLWHARGKPRCFWSSPGDEVAFAGAGIALEMMAWGPDRFQSIQRRVADMFAHALVLETGEPFTAPLLCGGFAFRSDFAPDLAWSDFASAHLILPHYQLVRGHTGMWLTLNARVPFDEDPRALAADLRVAVQHKIAELQVAPLSPAPSTMPPTLAYPQSPACWQESVAHVRASIHAGNLQKVVLSRIADVSYPTPLAIDLVLANLVESYPTAHHFLFEPRPRSVFVGATPELLARVQGHNVATMALAGSTRRGATPDQDAALIEQLLASPKDRREHQIVLDDIRARLAPLVSSLDVGQTNVLTLPNIHHLHTAVTGRLQQPRGILPLVETLHPTPAMSGQPREAALELIDRLEPFPRGWYAAPVGWIDCHLDGQFGVAIRSAVAQGSRMWLYAGAGIVADSDPQREWDETTLKFQPLLKALPSSAVQQDNA
jgi:menaquinone-specific isochorismate synthase